jgi:PIN domain nuclease of toxin-antitoxin system
MLLTSIYHFPNALASERYLNLPTTADMHRLAAVSIMPITQHQQIFLHHQIFQHLSMLPLHQQDPSTRVCVTPVNLSRLPDHDYG